MIIRTIDASNAWEHGKALSFALIYNQSSLYMGPSSDIQVNPDEVHEAFFFDQKEQVHLYKKDDAWEARIVSETEDDNYQDITYLIANRSFGETFTIREIFAFDEDGQTYRPERRLIDWKG